VKKLLLIGAGLIVLAIAAVVGGWWFFIREDAQLATEAPNIPEGLAQEVPDGGANGAGDVVEYRLIPEQSEAAYFADEKLASLPLPSTAKGTTNDIAGVFYLTPDGTALSSEGTSEFTVDLRSLQSDQSRRDGRVQDALETSLFPTATFTITGATGFDPSVPEGEEHSLQMTGTLELHGVQRDLVWDVKARREGSVITALATVNFRYDEFNVAPPNIAGFVSVQDDVTLQVTVVAALSTA